MTEETTIKISSQVEASNHAALAAFFENRSLIASQRLMDAVTELNRVNAENEELRASVADLSQPRPGDDEHASAVSNLNRVSIENEELRASITLMSKPRPQDQQDSALAELLRTFIADQVFTKAAIANLVDEAKRVVSPAEQAPAAAPEGGAN